MKYKLPILFIFPLLVIVAVTHAQETVRSFTISPPIIEVQVDPGEKREGKLKIVNDGPTPVTFNITTQDFIVEDSIGTPKILPPDTLSNKYSAANWVAIYPSTITIAPHSRTEFNYFIQVPQNAAPGGHYSAAIYSPTNTIDVHGSGAAVNTSAGTLFYVSVNGPITYSAKINNFLTKNLWEWGPINLTAQLENQSGNHIRPLGTVTLKNMFGGTSEVVKLPENNIFPEAKRDYEIKTNKGFMLGRYNAVLEATYGPERTPLTATVSFIVFPWRVAAFLILLALAIGFGYWYYQKDKKIKEQKPQEPVNNQTSSSDA